MQPSPGKTDPLINSVLLGTYKIERLLGKGGMGSVYAATHMHLQTPCAIKVLLHEYSGLDNSEALKRFQREAQITSQLGHPNIVRVTDFNFTPDGAPFMVMELLSGESLLRRLKTRGKLTLAEAVLMFGPLCDALGMAHSRHVIHRDLKPDNIFLPMEACLDGAKILDFGISKMRDGNTKLTKADVSMGTQSYMAPEIVCGAAAEADVRSDVFSMGAILYEVLTGQMAYDGPNAMAVMYKLIYQPPPSAHAANPAIPEPVDAVIQRALAQKPEERIATAPELFNELIQAAMPFLPAPEEMERQKSNPYRFTSSSMMALRITGLNQTVPAASGTSPAAPSNRSTGPKALAHSLAASEGRPTTGPKPFIAGPPTQVTRPQAPAEDVLQEEERPYGRKNKSGTLLMVVIAGLVLLTGVGLAVLRKHVLAEQKPAPLAPVAQPAAPPPQPAPEPAAAPPPTAPAEKQAVAPKEPAEPAQAEQPAEEPGKKHHHHHHGGRDLPHLNLPTLPEGGE